MAQVDVQALQKILDNHTTQIVTLEVLVAGLLLQIKATQGNESVHAAIDAALEQARKPRAHGVPTASTNYIQKLRDHLLAS